MKKTQRAGGNVTPQAPGGAATVLDGHRRAPLTRERILRTALRIMDEEGLDAITMRRIGRELGVEAMSLYNHVEDKEDILEGVSELVLSEFEFPEPVDDWEESVRAGARAWRSLLLAHPNVCPLLSERRKPIGTPEALRPIEYALEVLHRSGLTEQETVRAFRLFGGYVVGSVTMQVGKLMTGVDGAPRMTPEELGAVLPPELVPRFLQMLPHLQECAPDRVFEFGLDVLIAGIRARVRRRGRAAAVS